MAGPGETVGRSADQTGAGLPEGPVAGAARPWVRLWKAAEARLPKLPRAAWLLVAVVAIYVPTLTALAELRYLAHYSSAWDLGIFQQSLWTTAYDHRLLYYTAELPWNQTGSFLGVHFSPILLLVVPFYWAYPSPITLFVIQALAVGASAFPLYGLLARRTSTGTAALLSALYLLSPPVYGALLFDFHVEAFVPLFALSLWLFWEQRRYDVAILSGALLLMTIEYAPIVVGAIALRFALPYLWERRDGLTRFSRAWWIRVAPPLGLAAAMVPLTVLWFQLPKLFSPATPASANVGPLGSSVPAILWALFTQPGAMVRALSTNALRKLSYLFAELFTTLLVSALAPLDILPALPWLLVAILTVAPGYSGIVGYQYAFLTMPFLFVATGAGLARLERRLERRAAERPSDPVPAVASRDGGGAPARRWARGWRRVAGGSRSFQTVLFVLAVAAASQALYSPFLPWTHSWVEGGRLRVPTAHDQVVDRLVGLIPTDASVSAQPEIFPQVADRPDAYPYYQQGTEYLIVDLTSFWFTAGMPPPDPNDNWQGELRSNVTIPYGELACEDGVLLFEDGYHGAPAIYRATNLTEAPGAWTPTRSTLTVDPQAPLGAYLEPLAGRAGSFADSPSNMLPPGGYAVTLWIAPVAGHSATFTLNITLDNGATTLTSLSIDTAGLSPGWSSVRLEIVVPHPGELELVAGSSGGGPALLFGGASLAELGGPVVLG